MSQAKKRRGRKPSRTIPLSFGSKSGPTALVSASELKIMEKAGETRGLKTKTGKHVIPTKELLIGLGPVGTQGKKISSLMGSLRKQGISNQQLIDSGLLTKEEGIINARRRGQKPPAKETAPKTMTPELSRLVMRINSITKRGRQGKQIGSALVLTPEEAQIIKTINTKYNITLQEIGTKEAWNALTEAAVLEERIRLKRIRVGTQQARFDQEMGARIEEAVRSRIANNRAEISGYLEQLSGGGYGASVTSKVREAIIRKRVEGMVRDYLNIIITKHKLILTEEERHGLETKMSKENYEDIKKRLNL